MENNERESEKIEGKFKEVEKNMKKREKETKHYNKSGD